VTGHFCHSRSLCFISYAIACTLSTPVSPLESFKYSPIQGDGYSAQPCTEHGTNQSSVDFIHRQKQRDDLPPSLAVYTVYVYQRQCAEQRDVGSSEEGVHVMRGGRRAEENESRGEEWCCGERGKEE